MRKIKKCPFCGGDAELYRNYSYRGWFVQVQCNVCGGRGKAFHNVTDKDTDDPEWWQTKKCEDAIDRWNARVGDV